MMEKKDFWTSSDDDDSDEAFALSNSVVSESLAEPVDTEGRLPFPFTIAYMSFLPLHDSLHVRRRTSPA